MGTDLRQQTAKKEISFEQSQGKMAASYLNLVWSNSPGILSPTLFFLATHYDLSHSPDGALRMASGWRTWR
jgi:hypothetical protein